MTQLSQAKTNRCTEAMKQVAETEGIPVDTIRALVAQGTNRHSQKHPP